VWRVNRRVEIGGVVDPAMPLCHRSVLLVFATSFFRRITMHSVAKVFHCAMKIDARKRVRFENKKNSVRFKISFKKNVKIKKNLSRGVTIR